MSNGRISTSTFDTAIAALETLLSGLDEHWEIRPEAQAAIAVVRALIADLTAMQQAPTVAPLYIYECDCYAPEDGYPIGSVILAASGEIEAMTVCGEKVGGSIVIKIKQLTDTYATGRRRIIWSNVQSWR